MAHDLIPLFKPAEEITPGDIAHMRRCWDGPQWSTDGGAVPARKLRFVRVGGLDGDAWHRRVAELAEGRLPVDLAPCALSGLGRMEVRSVCVADVDWSSLEDRDWRALAAMGLPPQTEARLRYGT